jgi:hypothetical protein
VYAVNLSVAGGMDTMYKVGVVDFEEMGVRDELELAGIREVTSATGLSAKDFFL